MRSLEDKLNDCMTASTPILKAVHPVLANRVYSLIDHLAKDEGLFFGAQMGYRTPEVQVALYAQGRNPIEVVNQLRKAASLSPITNYGNRSTVTTLKVGYHNFGMAVDLVEDGDEETAGMQWSWSKARDYAHIGAWAGICGLEWGGLWKSFTDLPHVQLTAGMKLPEVVELYHRGGLDLLYAEVSQRTK